MGREHDVAEVTALLDDHRLVTLVGAGGVGKTRLALQVATGLLDGYRDGAWFVDLAPLADRKLVSSVIAQAMGMSQQQGSRIEDAIPQWLKHKQLLLVFDNCEHVVETIAPTIAAILRMAPRVRMLATSRQALNIGGEEPVRIPSLEVPRNITGLSAADMLGFAAVSLFVTRATTADRSFALTDDAAPVVADICRRLDGIPLAIELAAARVKVLSLAHLAERLNERFKLLTGGSRTALPRQQTLQALLDWSYDLLTEEEQLLFARCGIFAGGFALEAATSICGGAVFDELAVVDLLGSLTDKSLVVAETSGDSERYRLLESTAAYAMEKLRASSEYDALARRHAHYFRDQAEAADERYGTGSTQTWLARMETDLDNYRSALTWALTQSNDGVVGAAIAGALASLWRNAGLAVEGRYWVERALQAVNAAEQPRVAARLEMALSSLFSGKRSRDAAERAMRLYAAIGDARGTARAQSNLAFASFQMGECDAAEVAIAEVLAAARACGDARSVADALNVQASIEHSQGRYDAAREGFAQALAAYKALANEAAVAIVLINVAELEFADGHPEQAVEALDEAHAILRSGKNAYLTAIGCCNTAAYRVAMGDLAGARESARQGLRVAHQGRVELYIAVALQHLALLAGLDGNGSRGAQLLGYVEARYSELGYGREDTEQWSHDKLLVALRAMLSADEILQRSAEGAAWSEDRAIEEALLV